MLCPNPAKRVAAAAALTSDIFRFAETKPLRQLPTNQVVRQRSPTRSILTIYLSVQSNRRLDSVGQICRETLNELVASHFVVTIRVEECATDGGGFHLRKANDVLSFKDEDLPNEDVHLLRLGQSYRLHIAVTRGRNSAATVGRMASVCAKGPDKEIVELQSVVLMNTASECEAVALLDLSAFQSPVLRQISPMFGSLRRRYATLEVQIQLKTIGHRSRPIELSRVLYCKLVHQHHRLLFHRCLKMSRQLWTSIPQWLKDITRFCMSCIPTAIETM